MGESLADACELGCTGVVDTGTSLLVTPQSTLQTMRKFIGSTVDKGVVGQCIFDNSLIKINFVHYRNSIGKKYFIILRAFQKKLRINHTPVIL